MAISLLFDEVRQYAITEGWRTAVVILSGTTFATILSTLQDTDSEVSQEIEVSYPNFGSNPINIHEKNKRYRGSFSIGKYEHSLIIKKARLLFTTINFNSFLDFPKDTTVIIIGLTALYVPHRLDIYRSCVFTRDTTKTSVGSPENVVANISFESLSLENGIQTLTNL